MGQTFSQTASAACSYARKWHDGARLISNASLNIYGSNFLRDLTSHAPAIDRFSRGTGSLLAHAMDGYTVAFASTGKDNCLDIDSIHHCVIVNRDYFDAIASLALNSYEAQDIRVGVAVRRLIRSATRSTVRLVIGHELCHPEQGLPTINAVRHAAKTIGWQEIAKFDADADFRGASVEASLSALDDGQQLTYARVLQRFEDALTFQLRYCVPAFGCPPAKPHKRSRAAAIAIQLARTVFANRSGRIVDRETFCSLTMPLYITIDEDYSKIGVIGLDPMLFIGSAHFDIGELREFFDGLDSGDVETIVKQAITLCMRVGLIPT